MELTQNNNKKVVNLNHFRGGHYDREMEYQNKFGSDSDWAACSQSRKLDRAKRVDNFEINHLPKLIKKYKEKISYDGEMCCFKLENIRVRYFPKANSTNIKGKWLGGLKSFLTAIESISFRDLKDTEISSRFLKFIDKHYKSKNSFDKTFSWIPPTSGVYLFVSFCHSNNIKRIVYVGSSNNLYRRYISHSIPDKITMIFPNAHPIFYFLEMEKGFYDYEMKLIRKLKPIFNKLTYGG